MSALDRSSRTLWFHWALASALGWAGGTGLLLLLLDMGSRERSAVGLAACGLVVGLVQWVVLRRQIPRAGWWVVSSALGIAAAALLTYGLLRAAAYVSSALLEVQLGLLGEPSAPSLLLGTAAGAFFGAAAGYGQTWGLPGYVRRDNPWAIATAAGAALDGLLLGLLFSRLGSAGPLVGAFGALLGPLKGILTGFVLVQYDLK